MRRRPVSRNGEAVSTDDDRAPDGARSDGARSERGQPDAGPTGGSGASLPDVRRAGVGVDDDLVKQAKQILGTPKLTATINQALRAVVDRDRSERFIKRLKTQSGLDLDDPRVMDDAWR